MMKILCAAILSVLLVSGAEARQHHRHHRHHVHHHTYHVAKKAKSTRPSARQAPVVMVADNCFLGIFCGLKEVAPRPFAQEAGLSVAKRVVADIVARETRQQLGQKWVATAIKIAKVESGLSCHVTGPSTHIGHALGVMQVMPSSARALGYAGPMSGLLNCQTGAEIGVAHMVHCLSIGADTPAQMAACHVGGKPYPVNNYARWYVHAVLAQR